MVLNDAQQLFGFFFAIYFSLIIDRSHGMYGAWDTYAAWRRWPGAVNRLIVAWLLLVILPVTHFAVLFTLLGLFNVNFDETALGVAHIVLISISSFFTFGYFRLFEALIHSFPERFFADNEQTGRGVEIRPAFPAHVVPALLYIALSTLLLLVALYI